MLLLIKQIPFFFFSISATKNISNSRYLMIYLFLDTGLNFFLRLKMIYVSNSIVYNSYNVKNKYSETTILIWLSRLDALGFSVCYAI